MKKLLVLLVLGFAAQASAQTCPTPGTRRLVPLAYEEKTASTSSQTLTVGTHEAGADSSGWGRAALNTVETDSIRWRVSGTPTSASGHLMAAGQAYLLCSHEAIVAFKFIRAASASADAKLFITYFKLQ